MSSCILQSELSLAERKENPLRRYKSPVQIIKKNTSFLQKLTKCYKCQISVKYANQISFSFTLIILTGVVRFLLRS